MNFSMDWYLVVNFILQTSIHLILVTVLAIGWMRHRRLGFLVLALWAVVSLLGGVGLGLLAYNHSWLRKVFPNQPVQMLVMIPHLCSYFITSVMLGTGLALLVFRKDGKPSGPESSARESEQSDC